MIVIEIINQLSLVFNQNRFAGNLVTLDFKNDISGPPLCGDQNDIDRVIQQPVAEMNFLTCTRNERSRNRPR